MLGDPAVHVAHWAVQATQADPTATVPAGHVATHSFWYSRGCGPEGEQAVQLDVVWLQAAQGDWHGTQSLSMRDDWIEPVGHEDWHVAL